MSGEISSKSKHTVSPQLYRHDLPSSGYRRETESSSLPERPAHAEAAQAPQPFQTKLRLCDLVLKLLREEKPSFSY